MSNKITIKENEKCDKCKNLGIIVQINTYGLLQSYQCDCFMGQVMQNKGYGKEKENFKQPIGICK